MYTFVPRQVREDMQWMADTGADAIMIGVLEQKDATPSILQSHTEKGRYL